MNRNISILIADDHYLIAKLIKMMLLGSTNKNNVTIVDSGQKVFDYVKSNKIDILFLDIDMPEIDGIRVLKKIKKSNPEIKVIMISNHIQAWIINRALKFGADGYVSKYADSEEVFTSIKSVLNNKQFLCSTAQNSLNSSHSIENDNNELLNTEIKLGNLSKREIEILKLIVEEYSSKDISEKLFISIRTVETHRKHILSKLGVKNSLGLIRLFVENDLLNSIEEK